MLLSSFDIATYPDVVMSLHSHFNSHEYNYYYYMLKGITTTLLLLMGEGQYRRNNVGGKEA